MKVLFHFLLACILTSCAYTYPEDSAASVSEPASQEFDQYWYSGRAEITSYDLKQARYGEMHAGEIVMVFVTEDFLKDTQVKRESDTKETALSILKLNKIDRFTTGIYDYSIMLSTFTPVDQKQYPYSLKSSFSAQDWCGQSFMQLNRKTGGYEATVRSYFEMEGDAQINIPDVKVEDELWTLARLEPRSLPQGKFKILPSSQHLMLKHIKVEPLAATARMTMEVDDKGAERFIYTLTYDQGRSLTMYIQTSFPHRILGWEEKSKSGFGAKAKELVTTATMKSSLNSAYWGQNSPADEELRKQLKLRD